MLTDMQCRSARATGKTFKLYDDRGLILQVSATGYRSWRMKYRFPKGGPEKKLVFGPYPEVSLAEARDKRDAARKLLRDHTDPGVVAKQKAAAAAVQAGETFLFIGTEWHEQQKRKLTPRYAKQIWQRFEKHVFPEIGGMPIASVTAALVLQLLRKIEATGAYEIAHRVRQHVSDVFVYAIATGRAADDPAHVIRKAMIPAPTRLRPAVTKIDPARQLLRTSERHPGYPGTKLALRLLALTAARPGMVRLADIGEFEDLDGAEPLWRIPAAKMKLSAERRIDARFEFVIPLTPPSVAVIRAAMSLTGGSGLLFPARNNPEKAMSDNTMGMHYRHAGYTNVHVPHGWRSTFSTIMNERAALLGRDEDRAIIDLMLAHIPDNVEASYNRSLYIPRRRELAGEWSELLLKGAPPAAALLDGPRH